MTQDETITSLCDRLERIHLIASDPVMHYWEKLTQIKDLSGGFITPPASAQETGPAPNVHINAWVCPKCNQLNSAGSGSCGRCEDI